MLGVWWLARRLPGRDSVSPPVKSSFLDFELRPALKEDPDKQSRAGGGGLASTEKHNHFGEEGGKAVPRPQNQQKLDSLCIPPSLTLIPTITYLRFIALQVFRG